MNRRLRIVLVPLTIAVASLAATSVGAQSPDDPAPTSNEPIVVAQGNEVVHSWALTPAGTDEQSGVGNRSGLTYVTDPGTEITDAVTLFNLSNVPLVFRIYSTDAFNNTDGQFDLLGADEVPVDVGTWVDLGGQQIPLDARTQATIPIKITVPENATPGDHTGAILASNAAVSTGEDGQQLTLDRRTGTQITVRVNGPLTAELAIGDIETDYQWSHNPLSGAATVSYTVENRGNVTLGGSVQASVGGPLGIGEQKGTQTEIAPLLPGGSVTLTEEFENVPALGVAVTKVQLDPEGDGEVAVSSSSRQSLSLALPITVLMLLLSLLFALLAWRAYRRHQQRIDDPTTASDIGVVVELDREPEHQPT